MIRGHDPIPRIAAFNRGRHKALLALKYRKMATSPFAYFRGTNHLFHEDWPGGGWLDGRPPVWLNGDLHVENFGTYRADNRLVYFDIGDFDDACLGPPGRDLARFLVGLNLAAGGTAQGNARESCATYLDAYRRTLSAGKARWIERRTAGGSIGRLLHELERRTQADLLIKRTHGKGKSRRLRLDNGKAMALPKGMAGQVSAFMTRYAAGRAAPEFFDVLDVAWRVAGLGALGLPRFVVLVRGDGEPDGAALLDFKTQRGSTLAPCIHVKQPRFRGEATRVVEIESLMQVIGPAFLTSATIGRRSFTLRELQPSADKLNIAGKRWNPADLLETVAVMGELTASAELRASGRSGAAIADRLIEFAGDGSWVRPLQALARDWSRQIEADWKRFRDSPLLAWAKTPG